jgi:hypothetical protein
VRRTRFRSFPGVGSRQRASSSTSVPRSSMSAGSPTERSDRAPTGSHTRSRTSSIATSPRWCPGASTRFAPTPLHPAGSWISRRSTDCGPWSGCRGNSTSRSSRIGQSGGASRGTSGPECDLCGDIRPSSALPSETRFPQPSCAGTADAGSSDSSPGSTAWRSRRVPSRSSPTSTTPPRSTSSFRSSISSASTSTWNRGTALRPTWHASTTWAVSARS